MRWGAAGRGEIPLKTAKWDGVRTAIAKSEIGTQAAAFGAVSVVTEATNQ
jgi:hypothetical protein